MNAPGFNPSQISWYLINLPQRDGRLSCPRRLVTYQVSFSASRQSPIQVLTWPDDVQQLCWSDRMCYLYATQNRNSVGLLPFLTWYVNANASGRRCRYVGLDDGSKLPQDMLQAFKTTSHIAENSHNRSHIHTYHTHITHHSRYDKNTAKQNVCVFSTSTKNYFKPKWNKTNETSIERMRKIKKISNSRDWSLTQKQLQKRRQTRTKMFEKLKQVTVLQNL